MGNTWKEGTNNKRKSPEYRQNERGKIMRPCLLLLAPAADVCLCAQPRASVKGILGNSKQSNIKFPVQCHGERRKHALGKTKTERWR